MQIQKNYENQSLFRENLLVFDAKPQTLGNLGAGPLEIAQNVTVPEASMGKLRDEQQAIAAAADQAPLRSMVKRDTEDIKEMVYATLYPAQGSLNVLKVLMSETAKSVSQILGAWIPNPVKILARKVTAPVSWTANQVSRGFAGARSLFSGTSVGISMVDDQTLKLSAKSKQASEKVDSLGQRFQNTVSGLQKSFRTRIDGLEVPGLNKLQPVGAMA